ncbi:MAG: DUF2489 domain-containing protein [Pseudomonadales bacterium]|nr:DUF2489 domain-containing protein [Pseudomonadales bacterium]
MALAWQVVLAAITGLLIGTVLGLLLWRLWLGRQRKQELQKQQVAILDSLEVLCMAVEQEQVELSEAAIRMSVLLDSLPDVIAPKVDVSVIHQFAETCQQFDRGEERKGLTPRARHQQDSYRWQLEEEQKVVITEAAQRLGGVLPAWRASLNLSPK